MGRYRRFLIDVDGTLFDFDRSESEAFRKLCAHLGVPCTEELHAHYHDVNLSYWKLYEKGLAEREYFFPQRFIDAFRDFGYETDGQDANHAYLEFLSRECFVYPGAMELIQELSGRGFVYLCTNGDALVQERRLEASGILPYVAGVFISEKVGCQKPTKEYFSEVFKTVPYGPDCIMIGDSLTSDILGGVNASLDTVWYCPPGTVNDHPEIRPTYTVSALPDILKIIS